MSKRNLFDEISQGFEDLNNAREDKLTLRSHSVEMKPALSITPQELRLLRLHHHMSQTVFANAIRTNPRTYQRWEQGTGKPDNAATTLLRLVEKFPDTLDKLATI